MENKIRNMEIVQKQPGGKFVRIEFSIANRKLRNVRLTGDFFLHPEETILLIERALEGAEPSQVGEKIRRVLEKNNAFLVGVDPEKLEEAVVRALDSTR